MFCRVRPASESNAEKNKVVAKDAETLELCFSDGVKETLKSYEFDR